MSSHISDELPRLLTGEANRETVLAAAEHLRSCIDCQHELVSAVVAHASLTSAQRFAPEVVSGLPMRLLTDRPEHGPDSADAADSEDDSDDDSGPGLPDLSAVFARVRAEAAKPARRTRRSYVVAAAAAAVIVGGGTAAYVATSDGNSHGTTASRTVQLAAFDKGSTPATAKIDKNGAVSIDATTLPQRDGMHYEVWLTNHARTVMQPVGWLGSNGTAAMTVPSDLLSRFSDIEVSVQPLNTKSYNFSGTSVLRGNYS